MDVLNQLTAEQRTLVCSLPYRVGLWVSESDDAGGDEAHEKELEALANIIVGFSEQVFGSELLQYIMDETVKRKSDWKGAWAKDVDKIPEECKQALEILNGVVDTKEVNAYCTRLMEIGEAVALAFREYEQQSFGDQLRVYTAYIRARLRAKIRKIPTKNFDQFLNISLSERKALRAISDALQTTYYI